MSIPITTYITFYISYKMAAAVYLQRTVKITTATFYFCSSVLFILHHSYFSKLGNLRRIGTHAFNRLTRHCTITKQRARSTVLKKYEFNFFWISINVENMTQIPYYLLSSVLTLHSSYECPQIPNYWQYGHYERSQVAFAQGHLDPVS